MGGENFPLDDDQSILGIQEANNNVGGPHAVVYKNVEDRWAIVAMDWEGEPRLGMRWFWEGAGFPNAFGNPIWMIIPPELSGSILRGLPLTPRRDDRLHDYLAGNIEGHALGP